MIGAKLGNRYEVIRELGHGAMGVVYFGRDVLLEREVALKTLGANGFTPELRCRFLREARITAKLDHPGIVSVHDIGEHEESLFMVMPYIAGTDLRAVLNAAPLRAGHLLELGIQGAEALAHSHARRIVHRDLKPENILVAHEGSETIRIRISDFGIALGPSDLRITRSDARIGTLAYASPEQVARKPVDARTDLYAFGTVLYECITGEVPFCGDAQSLAHRILHERPRALRMFAPDIDEDLERTVMACLEKDPSKRTASARDLSAALLHCRAKFAARGRERSRAVETWSSVA